MVRYVCKPIPTFEPKKSDHWLFIVQGRMATNQLANNWKIKPLLHYAEDSKMGLKGQEQDQDRSPSTRILKAAKVRYLLSIMMNHYPTPAKHQIAQNFRWTPLVKINCKPCFVQVMELSIPNVIYWRWKGKCPEWTKRLLKPLQGEISYTAKKFKPTL